MGKNEIRSHIEHYKSMRKALRDAKEQQLSPLEEQIGMDFKGLCLEFCDRIKRSVDDYVAEHRLNDEVPGIGDMTFFEPYVAVDDESGEVVLELSSAIHVNKVVYGTDLPEKYKICEPDISREEKAHRMNLYHEELEKRNDVNSRIFDEAVRPEVKKIVLEYQIDMAKLGGGDILLEDLK